jgi:A/G-specific adenine glycosylase
VEKDIWMNLYDFPLIEKRSRTSAKRITEELSRIYSLKSGSFSVKKISKEYKHVLSHQVIHARFITIDISNVEAFRRIGSAGQKVIRIHRKKIHHYPLPRLIEKFLEKNLL